MAQDALGPEHTATLDPIILVSPEHVRSRTAEVWGVTVDALHRQRSPLVVAHCQAGP
jgi:hypothetical protein